MASDRTGAQIAAARMMGADMACLGARFIATKEATAPDAHKALIVQSRMADIIARLVREYRAAMQGASAGSFARGDEA